MTTTNVNPQTTAAATNWLTPSEAVSYLGLPSVRALYQAVRRKQVPVHRLGRRMRFDRSELETAVRRK